MRKKIIWLILLVMIIFGSAITWQLRGNFWGLAETNTVSVPVYEDQKKIADEYSKSLLNLKQIYPKTPDGQKPALMDTMISVAQARQEAMLKLIRQNPKRFLLASMPENLVKTFPQAIRQYLEIPVAHLKGTLKIISADNTPTKSARQFQFLTNNKEEYNVYFGKHEQVINKEGEAEMIAGVRLDRTIAIYSAKDNRFFQISTKTVEAVNVTTVTCVRQNPELDIEPLTPEAIKPHDTITYTVIIKNKNASLCEPVEFDLKSAVPKDWLGSFQPTYLTLASGDSGQANYKIISGSTAQNGNYPIFAKVQNKKDPQNLNTAEASFWIDGVLKDTFKPTVNVKINDDAPYTKTSEVRIALSGSDLGSNVAQIRYSNNSANWTDWAKFESGNKWDLANSKYGGNNNAGGKTVYVQAQDATGNLSEVASDEIVFDPVPPSGLLNINGNTASTTTNMVNLTLKAIDTGAGVGWMRLSNNGLTWSEWQSYQAQTTWDITNPAYGGKDTTGEKRIFAQFRDNAGNTSSTITNIILYTPNKPIPLLK